MKVYESIVAVLEEKGALPIIKICREVNQMLGADRRNPLLPSQIKSIISRKKDLFLNQEGQISIQPDKQLLHLIFILDGEQGISYKVHIYFNQKRFTFCKWRHKGFAAADHPFYLPKKPGDFTALKREIFSLKLWDWLPFYGNKEGIILGETTWQLKLETKGKIYISEGIDCYPDHWKKFCKTIEKLTGTTFQ